MRNQNIRVRLIVFNKGKVLLMRDAGHKIYYYPGGHVEFGETLVDAAKREGREECGSEFKFKKILYIRDYFSKTGNEHALEVFLLGKLSKVAVDNFKDPAGRKTQSLVWVDINRLPKNLYPKDLTPILKSDYKKDFPRQGVYVGPIR